MIVSSIVNLQIVGCPNHKFGIHSIPKSSCIWKLRRVAKIENKFCLTGKNCVFNSIIIFHNRQVWLAYYKICTSGFLAKMQLQLPLKLSLFLNCLSRLPVLFLSSLICSNLFLKKGGLFTPIFSKRLYSARFNPSNKKYCFN